MKDIYKKWWFWVIVYIVIGIIYYQKQQKENPNGLANWLIILLWPLSIFHALGLYKNNMPPQSNQTGGGIFKCPPGKKWQPMVINCITTPCPQGMCV